MLRMWITAALLLTAQNAMAGDDLPYGISGDLEVGLVARRLHSSFDARQLQQDAPNYVAARTISPGDDISTLDESGLRLRVVFGDARGFYAGGDGDALAVMRGPTVAGSVGGAAITSAPTATIVMHALVGWRVLSGRELLFGEFAGGGGITSYPTTCSDPSCTMRFREIGDPFGDVELRGGIDWFASSMVVVGATFGASVIDPGAFSAAVMIGVIGDSRRARRT